MAVIGNGFRALLFPAGFLAVLALATATTAATAAGQTVAGGKKMKADHYGGMLTNQTVTVAGQDFYRYFVFEWLERGMDDRFAIAIRERPSARWGTQISIEYAQRRVFHAQLPTARAAIKALSERAALAVSQQVADTEVERLLFRDADLGPDEF